MGDSAIALMVHDVHDPEAASTSTREAGLSVSTDFVLRTIESLRGRGFEFVALPEFLARRDREPVALLTFDDGYRSLCDELLPKLRDARVPILLFLISETLTSGVDSFPLWLYALRDDRGRLPASVLASIQTLPAIRRVLAANRAESLAELLERPAVELYQFFYPTLSYTELDGIREVLREGGWLRRTALAPDQIDELVASTWVEIGAHSIAHRYLPALPSREVRRQVLESCAVVAERVGQRVSEIAFSYPYGGVTPRARRLVSQRCIAGFTTTERPVSSLDSNALIPRLSLDERLAERLGIRPSRSAIALERTGIAIQPVRRLLREARRRLGSD